MATGLFSNIFSIIDPFNIMGFNDEESKDSTNSKDSNSSIYSTFSSSGIYPWDDDDDE